MSLATITGAQIKDSGAGRLRSILLRRSCLRILNGSSCPKANRSRFRPRSRCYRRPHPTIVVAPTPGYVMRGMHLLPKRGDKPEWQHTQDYWAEKDEFPAIDLDDGSFVYE